MLLNVVTWRPNKLEKLDFKPAYPEHIEVTIQLEPKPDSDWTERFNAWTSDSSDRPNPKVVNGHIVFKYPKRDEALESEYMRRVKDQVAHANQRYERELAQPRREAAEKEQREQQALEAERKATQERLERKLRQP